VTKPVHDGGGADAPIEQKCRGFQNAGEFKSRVQRADRPGETQIPAAIQQGANSLDRKRLHIADQDSLTGGFVIHSVNLIKNIGGTALKL
jgi:hypothetical protein